MSTHLIRPTSLINRVGSAETLGHTTAASCLGVGLSFWIPWSTFSLRYGLSVWQTQACFICPIMCCFTICFVKKTEKGKLPVRFRVCLPPQQWSMFSWISLGSAGLRKRTDWKVRKPEVFVTDWATPLRSRVLACIRQQAHSQVSEQENFLRAVVIFCPNMKKNDAYIHIVDNSQVQNNCKPGLIG